MKVGPKASVFVRASFEKKQIYIDEGIANNRG